MTLWFYLGEDRSLSASVAVEDAEKCVLEIFFILCLLVGHRKHVLHILSATLVTITGYPEIKTYRRGHLASRFRAYFSGEYC